MVIGGGTASAGSDIKQAANSRGLAQLLANRNKLRLAKNLNDTIKDSP